MKPLVAVGSARTCGHCGQEIEDSAQLCPFCGEPQTNASKAMGSAFQIEVPGNFERRHRRMAVETWTKFDAAVLPALRKQPRGNGFPAITRLRGWKNLWRYRFGDYRVVYRVHGDRVVIVAFGTRGAVYRNLGHIKGSGPSYKILEAHPEQVEPNRRKELVQEREQHQDSPHVTDPSTVPPASPSGNEATPLPQVLSEGLLEQCDVAKKYWSVLVPLETEGDLFRVLNSQDVPGEALEKVIEGLYPSSFGALFDEQAPTRIIEEHQNFGQAMIDGDSIESFALRLDSGQKKFVKQFAQLEPSGPWIVKGGPGTGKSIMALYCINELRCRAKQRTLLDQPRTLKILFTTYTNALTGMSNHLLQHLAPSGPDGVGIEIKTIDSMALELQPEERKSFTVLRKERLADELARFLQSEAGSSLNDGSPELDPTFLALEFEHVLFGFGISRKQWETYRAMRRPGRGTRLGSKQRERVWAAYCSACEWLREEKFSTYSQRRAIASHRAKAKYDYVFIDEAQDLSPAAIRMCVKLCDDPTHVFLTADLNQSIYGAAISWASIDAELRFDVKKGQRQRLTRNYRTTREICEGIEFLWSTATDEKSGIRDEESGIRDEESGIRPEDAVRHGEYPEFARHGSHAEEIEQIERFLRKALIEERLDLSCAAILCPTRKDCVELAKHLDGCFNAKVMISKEFESSYQGIRVMPFHTAKGLEFPVLVVARTESPLPPLFGADEAEVTTNSNRLFLVACSRAQQRLMVSSPLAKSGSGVLDGISGEKWFIAARLQD